MRSPDDVERRLPVAEPPGLVRDDRLGARRFPPAPAEALADDRLKVVDVVEVAVLEVADRGLDVARNGEVDDEQRPALALRRPIAART